MLAAERKSNDLMNAIAPYCSTLEQIEAEELLGSAFACAEHGPCDLQQSFEHYHRALELRSIHNLPKVLRESITEVFNNRHECQTIDQLEELRLNPENMYIEALIVRERLLGPSSEEYHYSVVYRGAILADDARYQEALAFWMYQLELGRQYSISIDPEDMRQFVALFSDMIFKSSPIPIEALLTIVATTVKEVRNNTEKIDYNLHTLLFLTTIISQVKRYFER
jgi:Fem-1 family protein b